MDKEYLKLAAQAVEARLPDNYAFILIAAPRGEPAPGAENRLVYLASMPREVAIRVLKEFLFNNGAALASANAGAAHLKGSLQ